MNITIQYPITDCRLFLHKSGKLRKPYFVSPDTEGREYIGISEPCRAGISRSIITA